MAIDRIDGLGAYNGASDNNNKRVQSREGEEDAGEFTLLKDEAEGVVYEPGGSDRTRPKTLAQVRQEIAAEEAEAARANLHSRFDGPGVSVELSTDAIEAATPKKPVTLFDIIRDIFKGIGEFFSGIWNGGEQNPASVQNTDDEATEAAAAGLSENEEVYAEEGELSEALLTVPEKQEPASPFDRDNSPEAAMAFLNDYGGGHLAKNSDLLTQYDRTGHIVSLDPTDKRRILKGEGRIRKY